MDGPERFSPWVRLLFVITLVVIAWAFVFLVVSVSLSGVSELTTELSRAGTA